MKEEYIFRFFTPASSLLRRFIMQKKLMAVSLIAALSVSAFAQTTLTNVQTGFNPKQAVIGGAGQGCVVSGQVLNGQPKLENCGGAPVAAKPAAPAAPAAVAAQPAAPAAKATAPAAAAVTKVTLKTDVLFATNQSTIKKDQERGMAEIAKQIKSLKSFDSVTVVGNADYRGGDAFNQKLSEKRAAAVAKSLTANGVPAGKIKSSGNGETKPLVGEAGCKGKKGAKLATCLAPDRRVDIDVVNAIR